jgi:hypothetical protein
MLFSVTAAAVLGAGLGTAPSLAATATTWTVSPGGFYTGVESGHFTLLDTVTGNSLVCANTHVAGTFKSGTGLPGAHIGTITRLQLSNCTGPGGLTVTITASHLPWTLSAVSYNPAITSGLTTGTVSGIHATVSGTNCQAVADGTSATANDGQTEIHYHNSLAKLKIRTEGSSLHFYGVSGCGGLFGSGDAITFASAYILTPAQTITQP